jgi:hypothetical protein
VVVAWQRAGAQFSITVWHNPSIRAAVATLDETAWLPIRHPRTVWGDQEGRYISDAEIAEVRYTAFTGGRKAEQVTARLLVRRVRRRDPASAPQGQGEPFAVHREHAAFTDSTLGPLEAEAERQRRAHVRALEAGASSSPSRRSAAACRAARWSVGPARALLCLVRDCLGSSVAHRATDGGPMALTLAQHLDDARALFDDRPSRPLEFSLSPTGTSQNEANRSERTGNLLVSFRRQHGKTPPCQTGLQPGDGTRTSVL